MRRRGIQSTVAQLERGAKLVALERQAIDALSERRLLRLGCICGGLTHGWVR
jgi:hypothetical protein